MEQIEEDLYDDFGTRDKKYKKAQQQQQQKNSKSYNETRKKENVNKGKINDFGGKKPVFNDKNFPSKYIYKK